MILIKENHYIMQKIYICSKNLTLLILLIFFILPVNHSFGKSAGKFIFVNGNVEVKDTSGNSYKAEKGKNINKGETVTCSNRSSAQLRMIDGAFLSIRPNTSLKLDNYRMPDKNKKNGKSIFSLLKGGFRAITGIIGKTDSTSYKVKTPVATIGIRGTDHEPMYIPKPYKGTIARYKPGLYEKVNSGKTYIKNRTGTITVTANQVAFTPNANVKPVKLSAIPEFYKPGFTGSFTDKENSKEEDNKETANQSTKDKSDNSEQTNTNKATENESFDNEYQITDNEFISETITGQNTESHIYENTTQIEQIITGTGENNTTINITGSTITDQTGSTTPVTDQIQTQTISYNFHTGSIISTYQGWGFFGNINQLTIDSDNNLTGWKTDNFLGYNSPNELKIINYYNAQNNSANSFDKTKIQFGTMSAEYISTLYVDEFGTTQSYDEQLYNKTIHWIHAQGSIPVYLPSILTGTATYVYDGGTLPTNYAGNTGSINSTSLSVDFSRQSVSLYLNLNIGSNNWIADVQDMPINFESFHADTYDTFSQMSVSINGDQTNTWGHIDGALTGGGANGAYISYNLGSDTDNVIGTTAFSGPIQNTDIPVQFIGFSCYDPRTPMPETFILEGAPNQTSVISKTEGNITAFNTYVPQSTNPGSSFYKPIPVRLGIGSCSLFDAGMDSTTGISWGRWSNGTISAKYRKDNTDMSPLFNPPDIHYIAGPETSTPIGLPISGTYNYAFAGGTSPTDNHGNVGSINSASLTADFTNMKINTAINLSVANITVNAAASNISIEHGEGPAFFTDDKSNLNIITTGSGAGETNKGVIAGRFTGKTGEGAAMVYSFHNEGTNASNITVNTTISGVAAFRR